MDPAVYGALFLTGLAAGFVDAIAGGGGLLTVPALLWSGLPPQLALGTNKLQAACGTGLAVWRYARAGLLRDQQSWLAVVLAGAASVGGTLAVTHVNPEFLRALIPGLLLGVGIYALVNPDLGREARPRRMSIRSFAVVFGLSLGFYDGFFGPGTGSFWTVALVGLAGLDLRRATAYTKAANLASNLGSLAVFLLAGKVAYGVGAVMIVGQLLGAYGGSHLVLTRGVGLIRAVFLTVVFALTIKLLWR